MTYFLPVVKHTNLTGPSAEHWVGSQRTLNSAVNREELLVQSWELKMWCWPLKLGQCIHVKHAQFSVNTQCFCLNPLNAELNPICHLLALVGAHHILHVSRIRVKMLTCILRSLHCVPCFWIYAIFLNVLQVDLLWGTGSDTTYLRHHWSWHSVEILAVKIYSLNESFLLLLQDIIFSLVVKTCLSH